MQSFTFTFISTPLPISTSRRYRTSLQPVESTYPRWNIKHRSNRLSIISLHVNQNKSLQENSNNNLSTQSKTKNDNNPIRTILLTLIAITTAVLPIHRLRTRQYAIAETTTIAKAIPSNTNLKHHSTNQHKQKNQPLAIKLRKKSKSITNSDNNHGLGTTPFTVAASAALLASALAVTITHPIDTLKTMKQAHQSGLTPTEKPLTLSLLYRGVFSNILKEAPNAAIYLGTYELFKVALLRLSLFSTFPLAAMCLAGMLGDGVGSIVRVPAEIINKRLQLGLSNCWTSAIKDSFLSDNGVESTMASWEAVLWRDVPYGGLQIAAYEFFRLSFASMGYHGLIFSVFAGAGAGLFAAVITTPADVLVTRMSTQSPQCYLETKHYMSPTATFVRIVKDEGFKALWTGALHRGLFYMPMIGLFFMAYESFKYMILNPNIVLSQLSYIMNCFVEGLSRMIGMSGGLKLGLILLLLMIGHGMRKQHQRRNESAHY